mmetsp:Transcript_9476/g.28548  ORF Transcript_9476/g.28548 Transcript_9476/m.28548 type:complete len:270 (+) Transcript_9476:162-971(+)
MTKAHSVAASPARPASTARPRRAPAYAMDRVALPLPFFAATTSVPASWTRTSSAGICSAGMVEATGSWEKSGRMVLPAWPPITGISAALPVISRTNLFARTTSSVVTPTILRGSRPFFFQSSHIAGTTEFTGLTMSPMTALGQYFATASTLPLAMPALTLSRSLRSWPGFRGMPAGTSTRWQPVRASAPFSTSLSSFSVRVREVTLQGVSKCDRSAATPPAGTIATLRSTSTSSFTQGVDAISSARGWPMPPAPPITQTLNSPVAAISR